MVTNTNAWQDRIGFGPFKRLQKSDIDDFSDDIDMLTIDDDDFSDTVELTIWNGVLHQMDQPQ